MGGGISIADHIITSLFPPDLATHVRNHILHPASPFQTYTRQAATYAESTFARLSPLVQPLIDGIVRLLDENQGVAGALAGLAVLTAIVVIMNWVRRLVMWWTRLVMRLAMLWTVALVVAWVWQRGVFETAKDVVALGGKVVGYAAVVKDVWLAEYDRYEGQRQQTMAAGAARSRRSGNR